MRYCMRFIVIINNVIPSECKISKFFLDFPDDNNYYS